MRLLVIAGILGGVLALLAGLPLAWVAPVLVPKAAKFEWQVASGTVWNGQIMGANSPFGPIDKIQMKMQPLAILQSKAPLHIAALAPGFSLQGRVGLKYFSDVHIQSFLSSTKLLDPRLQGLRGEIRFDVDELHFGPDCRTADGQVWSDVLQRNQAEWRWQGPVLSGDIRCEAGDLVVQMRGAEAGQNVTVSFRLGINGRYRSDLILQTQHPNADALLPVLGFEKTGRGFTLIEEGRWAYKE